MIWCRNSCGSSSWGKRGSFLTLAAPPDYTYITWLQRYTYFVTLSLYYHKAPVRNLVCTRYPPPPPPRESRFLLVQNGALLFSHATHTARPVFLFFVLYLRPRLQVPCDPNGKPMPWLWVVLLPFIDEKRLLSNLQPLYSKFTEEEIQR